MKNKFDKSLNNCNVRNFKETDLIQLYKIGENELIWNWYKLGGINSVDQIMKYVINLKKENKAIDFVLTDTISNQIIGFTALQRIDWLNKIAEIGSTFLNPDFWSKGYNKDSKLILIDIAFNELGLNKLKYTCNVLNKQSYHSALHLGFELKEIQQKGRKNIDDTWADFAHFELNK